MTAALKIPTIGIGAGDVTSGQVLVYHDLLGFMQHPHHAKVTPKFCKQYANVVGTRTRSALPSWRAAGRTVPGDRAHPFFFFF